MQITTWKGTRIAAVGGALLLGGCPAEGGGGPQMESSAGAGESSEGGGPPATEGMGSSGDGVSMSGASTDPGDTSGSSGEESDTMPGTNFIVDPDGNSVSIECSIWDQDCPPGEKCMPWANDGGNSWNATRCTAIAAVTGQPGDPCTVEGSGVSGADDCAMSSMCWNVDPETNEGTCIAFCEGSENNPLCDNPMTSCSITNEGVLALCLQNCFPLEQDCPTGEGCWQVDDNFVCAPDASGEAGAYGDPCEALNVCDPFLACFDAAAVPGCMGSGGCCTEVCDTEDPNASEMCAGFEDGQLCIPAFEMGNAPPGYEDVGYCLIPA